MELANPVTAAPVAPRPGAVEGKFQIIISVVPRLALDGPVQLRLPALLGVKQMEGELAYRLEGWQPADKTKNPTLTAITSEQFAKTWKETGTRDAASPTHAYSFRPRAGT